MSEIKQYCPVIRAYKTFERLDQGLDPSLLTPAEKLDISIFQSSREAPWKICSVKTDYGSVIDFTKIDPAAKELILSDPTFAESVVEKTWSKHPAGIFLPCKRQRDWTDKEAERLAIWKISKKARKAVAAA